MTMMPAGRRSVALTYVGPGMVPSVLDHSDDPCTLVMAGQIKTNPSATTQQRSSQNDYSN